MLKAEKAGVWQTPETLCQDHSWLLMRDGFQESCPCQESSCLFRFASTCPSSMSCNWWGVHAASQFIYITSTEQRVGMRVRSRDHCERTILFTVSVFAKGQINEECLLRNVESWASLSLADPGDLVLGRLCCCWCCCVMAYRNPAATRNHAADDWTIFAMLQEHMFVLVQCLASLANWCCVHAAILFL